MPQSDQPVYAQVVTPPTESSGGCLKTCLITFGVVMLLTLIVGGVGAWIVYRNAASWVARAGVTVVNQVIDESELPMEQKTGIKQQVDRIAQRAQQGKITLQELTKMGESIVQSPVIAAIPVVVLESVYLKKSGLAPDQKKDVERAVQRVARGMISKKIDEQEAKTLVNMITEPNGNDPNSRRLKQSLTDAEILEFGVACKQLADENAIPDEYFEVDLAREVKRIIDEGFGEVSPEDAGAAEGVDWSSTDSASGDAGSAEGDQGAGDAAAEDSSSGESAEPTAEIDSAEAAEAAP